VGLFWRKVRKKLRSRKVEDWVSFGNSVVVFEFPHLVFCGIDRFLGLFWMNPQETHSKVHRRKDTQFAFLAFCKLIRPVRHEIWTKLVGWKHEAITEIMFLGTMFLVRPVRHEIWTKLVGWKHEAITPSTAMIFCLLKVEFKMNNFRSNLGGAPAKKRYTRLFFLKHGLFFF